MRGDSLTTPQILQWNPIARKMVEKTKLASFEGGVLSAKKKRTCIQAVGSNGSEQEDKQFDTAEKGKKGGLSLGTGKE